MSTKCEVVQQNVPWFNKVRISDLDLKNSEPTFEQFGPVLGLLGSDRAIFSLFGGFGPVLGRFCLF